MGDYIKRLNNEKQVVIPHWEEDEAPSDSGLGKVATEGILVGAQNPGFRLALLSHTV